MDKARLVQVRKGCAKHPRLLTTARARAFASTADSRAYTLAVFASVATCGTVGAVPSRVSMAAQARAFAWNAQGRAYTPAACAKIATCGTAGAIAE
jgi:hypothetical protein